MITAAFRHVFLSEQPKKTSGHRISIVMTGVFNANDREQKDRPRKMKEEGRQLDLYDFDAEGGGLDFDD